MEWLIERAQSSFRTVVACCYLLGMLLGTTVYFAGHLLGFVLDAAGYVGIALAVAAELHSWLSQVHTRTLREQLLALDPDSEAYDAKRSEFRLHLGVTIALVAFSAVSGAMFRSMTWGHTPDGFGDWAQIVGQGVAIPVFFVCLGLQTRIDADEHAEAKRMLQKATRSMLKRTLRANIAQFRSRIREAIKERRDLTGITVTLLEDAGDHKTAHRLSLISAGLDGRTVAPAPTQPTIAQPAATVRTDGLDRPPTGQGAPSARVAARITATGSQGTPATEGAMPLVSSNPKALEPKRPAVLMLGAPETAEHRVRAFLRREPDASVKTIARRCGVAESTASKYRRIVQGEQERAERIAR